MCKEPLNPEVPISCEIKSSLYILFTFGVNCLQFCNFPSVATAAVYMGKILLSVQHTPALLNDAVIEWGV